MLVFYIGAAKAVIGATIWFALRDGRIVFKTKEDREELLQLMDDYILSIERDYILRYKSFSSARMPKRKIDDELFNEYIHLRACYRVLQVIESTPYKVTRH